MDEGSTMRDRQARTAGSAGRSASAGMPGSEMMTTEERMAELEERLARVEGSVNLRERGRDLMNRVMPPEAMQHFRNSGREQLLGYRSIIDFWIRRIETSEQRAASRSNSSHETIEIE
jgi:hypothetical protein